MIDNIWEHINDLKKLFIKIGIAWGIGCLASWYYINQIIEFITYPLKEKNLVLHFLSPSDSFMFVMKLITLFGFIASSPITIVMAWKYVSNALSEKEKKFIVYYTISTLFLAVFALVYDYYSLIPTTFNFLIDFTPKNSQIILTATEYSNFIISTVVFSIAIFQTPIFIFGLIKLGLVSAETFKAKRKEVYFSILVIIAAFGANDIISWLMLSVLMVFMFEVSLLASGIKFRKLA